MEFATAWNIFILILNILILLQISAKYYYVQEAVMDIKNLTDALMDSVKLSKERAEVVMELDKIRMEKAGVSGDRRRRSKGFTLIEFLIVLVSLGVLCVIWAGVLTVNVSKDRIVCVGGYEHTFDYRGSYRQILGENGGGIRCGE